MAQSVYILCALTSLACASFLGRAYLKTRLRLLLWSCICFIALAMNNILLVVDLVIMPGFDISIARGLVGLFGVSAMIYGLVWDAA